MEDYFVSSVSGYYLSLSFFCGRGEEKGKRKEKKENLQQLWTNTSENYLVILLTPDGLISSVSLTFRSLTFLHLWFMHICAHVLRAKTTVYYIAQNFATTFAKIETTKNVPLIRKWVETA